MKVGFGDYSKKLNASVLVGMAVFKVLQEKYPSKQISEIADTTSGGTPLRNNSEFYNGEIAWLKSGELNDGVISNAEEKITELGLKNSSAKLFPKGTLLIAMYGATTGKVGILDIEASTNQAVCAVFPKEEIDRDFLFWFFRQHRYEFIRISKGGAQPNISQTVINRANVPIPPIKEQKQIAQLLSEIEKERKVDEKLIEKDFLKEVNLFLHLKGNSDQISIELSHQLELVRQLRQAFLREAMQGKLVPQNEQDEPAASLLEKIKAEKEKLIAEKKLKKDKPLPEIKVEEIPFEIPDNWTWCRLGEIAFNLEYGTSEKGDLNTNNIAVLRMNNIQDGKVLIDNLKYVKPTITDLPRLYLKKGDLLFNRTNSYELVGKSGVFKGESDKLTFASYLIRVQFQNLTFSEFTNYYINSILCRQTQLEPDIIQQNGQANFNGTKLKNILVPLPPLAEQKRIVEKLEKLMKFCDELEANIREGKGQAESLLQVALKEALKPKEKLKLTA